MAVVGITVRDASPAATYTSLMQGDGWQDGSYSTSQWVIATFGGGTGHGRRCLDRIFGHVHRAREGSGSVSWRDKWVYGDVTPFPGCSSQGLARPKESQCGGSSR